VPPGWSEWFGTVDFSTYRTWGNTLNENGRLRTYGEFDREDPALYQTDVLAARADGAIRRASATGRPFFVQVAPLAAHFEQQLGDRVPPRSAPRHRGALADVPLPDDPSINEDDITDKAPFWQAINARRMTPADLEVARRHFAGQAESLLAVDDMVDRLVTTLRELGELENTYVVFTTDNGYFHGEHRFPVAKYFTYEPSSNLPFLIRGPGLPAGVSTRELSQDVDLAATIIDAADATAGRRQDGRSLLPYARDPALRTERPVLFSVPQTTFGPENYLDFDMDGPDPTPDVLAPGLPGRLGAALSDPNELTGEGEAPDPTQVSGGPLQRAAPGIAGVRTDRWAYWEYDVGNDVRDPSDVELYDMVRDPFQLQNLARDPAHLGTVLALSAEVARRQACAGDACRRGTERARRVAVPAAGSRALARCFGGAMRAGRTSVAGVRPGSRAAWPSRVIPPGRRTARVLRGCVAGGGRLAIVAAGGRVRMVLSTSRRTRVRGMGPGSTVRAARRRIKGLRRAGPAALRVPGTQLVLTARRGRVTSVGAVDRRTLRSPRRLAAARRSALRG